MSNKVVRGTVLLTGAAFLSKFLGMIYVIPLQHLIGARGGALYFYAYAPYTVLIGLSTVGIPLAVSKFVSRYNALGDYRIGLRMFKTGLIMMFFTGLLAFLILFFGAEWVAEKYIVDDKAGNTVQDVKMVIQMVSFALLIIPMMSIARGFFQGYQSMEPTALSQVVEQIVRIAFVLVSAFIIIYLKNGSITTAVGFATFAAFIGALASCVILILYWFKRKRSINEKIATQTRHYNLTTKQLIFELFSYAGPFVLVGIAIPLYQNVDSFTFNRAMVAIGQGDLSAVALSTINLYGHKLVIIPVTIATGLSLAILPVLTQSFTENNRKLLFTQINQSLQITLLLVVPAVVGLATLSYEAYGSLYGMDDLNYTGSLLTWYTPVALLFALFTVTSAILQGINEQRYAVLSLLVGFLVKVLLNSIFIHTFGAKGIIFATALAVGTAVSLNFWHIYRAIGFPYKETFKRFLLICIFSFIMWVVIIIMKIIFGLFLPYDESRMAAVFMLMIGVSVGGFVYLWFAYKSTLLERVLRGRIRVLDRFFSR